MISNRDNPAFEAFVRTSSDHLLRTAYLLSGDRGYAEDLVQTALLRTARRWRAARRQPHAYARRIVINLAKDRWRGLSRRPRNRRWAQSTMPRTFSTNPTGSSTATT